MRLENEKKSVFLKIWSKFIEILFPIILRSFLQIERKKNENVFCQTRVPQILF